MKRPVPVQKWSGSGVAPSVRYYTRKKKDQVFEMAELTFTTKKGDLVIQLKQKDGKWLEGRIPELSILNPALITSANWKKSYEVETGNDFILFWNSRQLRT